MLNFKIALKTTIIFVLCISLISIGLSELYYQGENWIYQDAKEREVLSGSVDFLISGASHGMRAFKPEVIDQELDTNSYNLSGSLMTMKGRYELLKIEIERNPVDVVVIELTYNSMTRNRNEEGPEGDIYVLGRLGGNPLLRLDYLKKAFPFSEYGQLYYDTIDRGVTSLKKLIKGTYTPSLVEFNKGYFPTPKPDKELDVNYSEIYNTEEFETEVYEDNVKYLEKIIALCKEHNAQVILVTTPLSLSLTCACSNLDVFYDWYVKFAVDNNIKYYDFNLLKTLRDILLDSESFYDRTHLNDNGAEIFSSEFCRIMGMVENGEDISNLFYSSYTELKENKINKCSGRAC